MDFVWFRTITLWTNIYAIICASVREGKVHAVSMKKRWWCPCTESVPTDWHLIRHKTDLINTIPWVKSWNLLSASTLIDALYTSFAASTEQRDLHRLLYRSGSNTVWSQFLSRRFVTLGFRATMTSSSWQHSSVRRRCRSPPPSFVDWLFRPHIGRYGRSCVSCHCRANICLRRHSMLLVRTAAIFAQQAFNTESTSVLPTFIINIIKSKPRAGA